jgi:5-formyltetrahydrofolate cyclo-ligase
MGGASVADWARDLVPGKHGIGQPSPDCPDLPPEQVDVILVPGIAFDSTCARLGRGAGFYDRFLADPRVRAVKIGVAFDEQIVDAVPMDRWDVRLDAVVTPTRVFERG